MTVLFYFFLLRFRHDVDDAGKRFRPVQRGVAAFDHFEPLDVFEIDEREMEEMEQQPLSVDDGNDRPPSDAEGPASIGDSDPAP